MTETIVCTVSVKTRLSVSRALSPGGLNFGRVPFFIDFSASAVNAMLLNEFLKEHRTVQQQQKEIDALKAELKEQRALIQKVDDKMELDRPAPQTVLNNQ